MDNQVLDYIKQAVLDFFKDWPFDVQANTAVDEDFITVEIDTPKNDIFIYPTSEPVLAIQHLIRLMVRKKFPDQVIKLTIDVGGYKKKRQEIVGKIAKEAIDKAVNSNNPINLSPMSSFERRLVHKYVSEDGRVSSESIGVGQDRYVVIKPLQ